MRIYLQARVVWTSSLLRPPSRICNRRCLSVCLSVCLLATLRKNFRTDLHEIFREGWQWMSMNKLLNFGGDPDQDPYRDTGKTCLGGCMHCRSASSFNEFDYNGQVSVNCPLQLRTYVCVVCQLLGLLLSQLFRSCHEFL